MAKFEPDSALVRKLSKLLEETGLSEIEYESGDQRIRVARSGSPVTAAAPLATPAPTAEGTGSAPNGDHEGDFSKHPGAVPSPMVGTIYSAPEPGAESYVRVGDTVKKGQTLLIVEAMKTMNPVGAPRAGKITQIFANNGDPVEFGEILMLIE